MARCRRFAAIVACTTSSRSPGTMSRLPGTDAFDDMARLHRADGHVLDLAVQVVARMEQLAGHLLDEHRQRRVGQDGSVGQGAQQADAVPREAHAQHLGQARVGVRVDLVDHGAQDLDAAPREQGVVEHDLVDGPADAGLRDDDRGRAQRRRDIGIGQADDRPDAGMPGPLHDHDVAARRDRRVCVADACAKVVRDPTLDERLGEAPRDVHRAHHGQLVGQPEHRPDQDGVLVRRHTVDHRIALADRLHEPGHEAAVQSAASSPSAKVVLPRFMPVAARYTVRMAVSRGLVAERVTGRRSLGRRHGAFRRRGGSSSRAGPRGGRTGCP